MPLPSTYGELTDTPIGPISMLAGDQGLRRLAFCSLPELKTSLVEDPSPSLKGVATIGALLAELNEYFFGIRKTFSVTIDSAVFSDFQSQVLQLALKIPYGSTMTYGDLARQLEKPGAARAVGRALAQNPIPIIIPCHRVIGADGNLHGYAAPDGVQTKAHLLTLEGHTIEDGRVV